MDGTIQTFERCARWLLARPGCGWLVIHGVVSGRGELEAEKYNHAWLELPGRGIALDMSTDEPILVAREKYLDITSADPVAQYDATGIQLALELHSHYGPWQDGVSRAPAKRLQH